MIFDDGQRYGSDGVTWKSLLPKSSGYRDGDDNFITMKGHHIMNGTDKGSTSKVIAAEPQKVMAEQAKATTDVKAAESVKTEVHPAIAKSNSSAEARTKMDIATEVYKRMKRAKGVTRKEIIEQFVVEAKLSKAGASTYYQLIRSRVK